ncbi:MAG: hypothetical protein SGPRY_002005 [Prymnesium sp.]
MMKIFKALDPLRAELKSLVNLTPPKVVVIGDESSGKSTVLEQLIGLPLFPRKKTFCTRMPIHVRLRRPDAPPPAEEASVKLSIVTMAGYRENGREAQPIEPPVAIATANGFQYVQDKMDELEASLAGETGGVVMDRIIVLDVVHPEVPVIDLIDLPGIVSVNVDSDLKREAVERLIAEQIGADQTAGMTSFYLVIVPAGERPNTNCALKLIQSEKLLDHAIGVFTKCDEVRRQENLFAFVTGEDFEDEDDGSIVSAASLGEVKLAKGWTVTMLAMPKKFVEAQGLERVRTTTTNAVRGNDGQVNANVRVNYYAVHNTERLKKQREVEKMFFGGRDAAPKMKELYDLGLAGVGALASKLTREYFEYSRGEWLEATLVRLFHYELELKSRRALLGATDVEIKDCLAAVEIKRTLDDVMPALSERFVRETLLGTLMQQVEEMVNQVTLNHRVAVQEVNNTLASLEASIEAHVVEGVSSVASFYADELAKLLGVPIIIGDSMRAREKQEQAEELEQPEGGEERAWEPFKGTHRLWTRGTAFAKSLFGTSHNLPASDVELHKCVVAEPIIQLAHYPEYVKAVERVLRAECVRASERAYVVAAKVVQQLANHVSSLVEVVPDKMCQFATIHIDKSFFNKLKMAFLCHLPTTTSLQVATSSAEGLKLSAYEELSTARQSRLSLDERIARVRQAARALVAALDVDEARPLDGLWLHMLLCRHSLPTDDPLLPFKASSALDRAMQVIFGEHADQRDIISGAPLVCTGKEAAAMLKVCEDHYFHFQPPNNESHDNHLQRLLHMKEEEEECVAQMANPSNCISPTALLAMQAILGLACEALVASAPSMDSSGFATAIHKVMTGKLAESSVAAAKSIEEGYTLDCSPVEEYLQKIVKKGLAKPGPAAACLAAVLSHLAMTILIHSAKQVGYSNAISAEDMQEAIRGDDELAGLVLNSMFPEASRMCA